MIQGMRNVLATFVAGEGYISSGNMISPRFTQAARTRVNADVVTVGIPSPVTEFRVMLHSVVKTPSPR